jgi:hypothetical protein
MPRMYCSHVAYCTALNVQTLTTSRFPKISWQSEFGLGSSSAVLPPGSTAASVAYARGLLYYLQPPNGVFAVTSLQG